MHPDTVVLALEAMKAILEYGGSPASLNSSVSGEASYSFLAEEADVNSRLDFLVSSPNEQVALLAMEILHEYMNTNDDDVDLPDDLVNIIGLQPLKEF